MNKQETRQKIIGGLNLMSPTDRIDIIYDLFTSDLLSEKIGEPGTKVLHFKNLENGEKFIGMPKPGDDGLHGGLKGWFLVFTKIQGNTNDSCPDKEKDNAKDLSDESLSTMPPEMHVIKIA